MFRNISFGQDFPFNLAFGVTQSSFLCASADTEVGVKYKNRLKRVMRERVRKKL